MSMRASRLLAILILLQLKVRVTAPSMAQEFDVSERTIYRDMDELSAAGVPVYAERGRSGGFQLLGGYRTDLTGLTLEEAKAVLMIGMPDALNALGLGEAMERSREKLLAALPADSRLAAKHTGALFHFDPSDWYRNSEPVPHLPALARALLEREWLTVVYQSWRGERRWVLAPYGLVMKAGEWYLVAASAHDHKTRTFKAANLLQMEGSADHFERLPTFDLPQYWRESLARFETELRSGEATLRVTATGKQRLAHLGAWAARAVAAATDADAEGKTTVVLPVEPGEQCLLELLSLGPEVEVVAPIELRQRLLDIAMRIAALHVES